MEKFKKIEIHQVPQGYFDQLPERILERYSNQKSVWFNKHLKFAAAAVLLIGMTLWVVNFQNIKLEQSDLLISQEIDLYIDTEYWQAEDILLLTDNPNDILDEIIASEWGNFHWSESETEDDFWY
ncbi:hypothetical protein [Cecembia rubra]|uniref:hypothetical protein n=1 Tax=Cecembia rubra TaxID=1485585 RepID=UPI0027153B09|nr:hypothetical protein [Cecembia rubra]